MNIGLVVVCAVNPESFPPPSTSSSSSTHCHYRGFFKYFPKIHSQDVVGLASANFHEIWNVTGQKSLWPGSGWEAMAGGVVEFSGEALYTPSFNAEWSGENSSALTPQRAGLLGAVEGRACCQPFPALLTFCLHGGQLLPRPLLLPSFQWPCKGLIPYISSDGN